MAAGIARSVGFVILFVCVLWLLGLMVGFEVGLVSTLIASIVLTVLANFIFLAFQRSRT